MIQLTQLPPLPHPPLPGHSLWDLLPANPQGQPAEKAWCTLVEANGDLLVHDPINTRHRLEVGVFRISFYLSIQFCQQQPMHHCSVCKTGRPQKREPPVPGHTRGRTSHGSPSKHRQDCQRQWRCRTLDYTLAEEIIGLQCVLSLVCSWFNSFINWRLPAACSLESLQTVYENNALSHNGPHLWNTHLAQCTTQWGGGGWGRLGLTGL